MNSLASLRVDEIFTPEQNDVDARDLAQAGIILKDNMLFMAVALEIICKALRRSGIQPGAPVTTLLHKTAVELECLATCVRRLMQSLYDLDVASRFPPVSTSIATETLSKVDSYLTTAQNSTRAVYSICGGSALPRAVYSPYNPIPTLCQCFRWIPPSVALWRELVSFTDVLTAMDSVLPAARTLRHFLKQALDAPGRFIGNQELMRTFCYDFMVPLEDGYRNLELKARNLQLYCAPITMPTRT
ncbi:hypothetical protein B0H10DRAFT_2235671 [Mycena sp. CBHHK59/15]|nr:hypothetical protein B0H10DRAFT_2238267 [Mycena sp. CBHHK59/15]KAJ6579767.1 hypothetical protein B0H10DRAFT_2235671 [Mycena sp. CBHHK59/15]